MDETDFFTSKEMISVADVKFFPQKVKSVLERHPAIQNVCIFGVKALRSKGMPEAHLVLINGVKTPNDTALKDYCTRPLACYKILDQFQWVKGFAYTASGKLIRNANKL